jgi:6-phosphogluconolactonase (cycloisomerase 2 family)
VRSPDACAGALFFPSPVPCFQREASGRDPSPRDLSHHRQERFLRWTAGLLAIALPAAGGLLTFLQVIRSADLGEPGLGAPVALAVSPDGRHLYVAGRDDNALVVFARDATSGHLTFVDAYVEGENGLFGMLGPSGVAVSPDGRHVYVSTRQDDALVVFARDPTLDTLSFVEIELDGVHGVDGLDGAASVTVSPDDVLVLVAGFDDDALAVFRRDPTTDDLTFLAAEIQAVAGVDGLDGASAVAVSPDSAFAYLAGALDAAVAVFARDPTNDHFGFVEASTGTALGGVADVTLPADGRNLYAAAYDDDAVTAFARDASAGTLSLLATYVDGAGGFEGLDGALSIVLRSQLDLAFVAGQLDNRVAVLARDPDDGRLFFSQALADGEAGIEGLDGPSAVVASPDGRFLYAAAEFESAVVVFRIDALDFGDAPTPYPTTLGADGARHDYVPGAPFLGTAPDADPDGQPASDALGDDLAARPDEDGVVFLDPLLPGAAARVEVTVTAAARLDAWIDFNADGGWGETGDKIFDDLAVAAGTHTLSFTVPVTATPNVATYARFRVSSASGLGAGGAAADGEIEDYALMTVPVELTSFGIE